MLSTVSLFWDHVIYDTEVLPTKSIHKTRFACFMHYFFFKKNLLIRLQCTFPFLHVSLKSKSIVILMFESLFLLGRGTKLTEVSVSDKLEGFRAAKEV